MQQRKGWKIAAGFLIGIVAIAALAWAADYLVNRGNVPRGATVGGVAIGGMAPAAAVDRLESEFGDVAAEPVNVHSGDMTSQFVPAESGLGPDWEATVTAAGEQSLNPWTRLRGLFTTFEVDVVSTTDEAAFEPAMDRVQAELSRDPKDAAVRLEGGEVIAEDAVPGQTTDRAKLAEAAATEWLDPEGVRLSPQTTDPAVPTDALADARVDAQRAVSAPVTAHGRNRAGDAVDGVIPPDRMGEVVTFVPDGAALRADVNADAARGILAETLAGSETDKRNAQITFTGSGRQVTPSEDGHHVDWEATLADLPERIVGDAAREFDVAYTEEPATFTTEQAEAATFDETVGEFTTGGFSGPSGTNIGLVAAAVDGAIVAPGDTFSLNGYTGPRGTAQGYVESGIILDGHSDTAVGGGISQFATTLYNASYFAGMTDVAHTAHSYYISRYPAGREATVFEGLIDLQFRNDSPYPVMIDTSFGGGQITVSLKGVKTVEVESVNGGRWNATQPQQMQLSGPTCAPSGGAPGFTTSDTRIIRDLNGAEISRETTTTVYDPQPIVTCS